MKNFLFVSIIFCIISAGSFKVTAQNKIRFIDGIEILSERVPLHFANPAPQTPDLSFFPVDNVTTERCSPLQFKYAQMTDQEVENIKNIRLYKVVDEWYNVRYRLGGDSKKGIDCSSFTSVLLDAVYSYCLPRTARQQYQSTERLEKDQLKEGDLVFFNTRGGISHVGVYLANGFFVHASSSSGVMISHLDESYFASRYKGAGRYTDFHDVAIFTQ